MSSTILTSIITSLIVSTFTFIIGLKAGKNQSDRAKLKDLYRVLAVYFEELLESIRSGKPKQWNNYQDKNFEFMSPLKKVIKEGNYLDLSEKITKDIAEIEKEAMMFGYFYRSCVNDLDKIVIKSLEESSIEPIEITKYDVSSKIKGKSGKFFEEYLGIIIIEDEVNRVSKRFASDKELGISLLNNKNSNKFRINIYADSVQEGITKFLLKLHSEIIRMEEVQKIIEERNRMVKILEVKLAQIQSRTRDPHPPWETFIGAFFDLIKG